MSLKSPGLEPIPEETRRLVKRLCPKGTTVTQLRDALGPIYSDVQFAHLFPQRGRAAEAPWRLALVTVLQAIEGLTDRQAAEGVRTRIDWLYALALPLDDPGFDYTILTDFRQRLLDQHAEELILEPILQLCRQRGWLKAGGKQRTDATAVLARVRARSLLESVGEGMRATLNALAEQDPDWLSAHLNPQWFDRYVHRFELARFPKAETERKLLREQVGQDVAQLLAALAQPQTPQAVRALAEVALLRQLFAQHYEQQGEQVHWRDGPAVSNEDRIVSPYDPEARSSRKRDSVWLGYKVHLTETCDQDPGCPHLIAQVETTRADRLCSRRLCPRLAGAGGDLSARAAECGLDPPLGSASASHGGHPLCGGHLPGVSGTRSVYARAGGPHAHPHATRGACGPGRAACRANQPCLCAAVCAAGGHRRHDRASRAHHALAPHALRWAAQNASASCGHCRWPQSEADRGSSACAIPRQTDPSCAPKIVVRSLAGPGGGLMFGHLYRISQQSHKSAPTGIRVIFLKPIISTLPSAQVCA